MNRMIVWAMMLIATIATTASCSSDNDGNDTLSANDKAQMYGHYQSLAIYGDNITTSAIDVNVSEDHVKFTVPVVTILAACELGKRRQREKAEERADLGSAQAIYEYMHPRMQDLDVEEAWVLLMNQNFKLIKAVRISHGGISETAVDVRVICREAILCNATVVALCHNHPSGNNRASGDDDRITQRVEKACQTMRLYFLDHLIITDGDYYSYRENGKL